MNAVAYLESDVGVAQACTMLGVPRASYYRALLPSEPSARPAPPRKLSEAERTAVLDVLHEARFVDVSPAEVHATLLDEGRYLCSERTMYRILSENDEVRERRNQLRHQDHPRPELLATRPNELWSWDITKLKGPAKWTYFYLYVVLDVFSRYVVGWMLATKESAELAKQLLSEIYDREGIDPAQLTLHADRGSAMTAKSFALMLSDLGVTKTHSRPYVSNDNPFSESAFKTLKYRPGFPGRFGSEQDARAHCRAFFEWYNNEHRHGGLAMCTPTEVHHGLASATRARREAVLEAAFLAHPERFPHGRPVLAPLPTEVWINEPIPALPTEGAAQ